MCVLRAFERGINDVPSVSYAQLLHNDANDGGLFLDLVTMFPFFVEQ